MKRKTNSSCLLKQSGSLYIVVERCVFVVPEDEENYETHAALKFFRKPQTNQRCINLCPQRSVIVATCDEVFLFPFGRKPNWLQELQEELYVPIRWENMNIFFGNYDRLSPAAFFLSLL